MYTTIFGLAGTYAPRAHTHTHTVKLTALQGFLLKPSQNRRAGVIPTGSSAPSAAPLRPNPVGSVGKSREQLLLCRQKEDGTAWRGRGGGRMALLVPAERRGRASRHSDSWDVQL